MAILSDNVILTDRQRLILQYLVIGREYTSKEIHSILAVQTKAAPSAPTLRRDLAMLCEAGFLLLLGANKSARYQLSQNKVALLPIDAHQYCQFDIDVRPGAKQFNFELFSNLPIQLFSSAEVASMQKATDTFIRNSVGVSETVRKKELERFVIELSWKSSKIEGNTYTLLDTELLLRDGKEAEGHTREEAVMILNHKRAFDFILSTSDEFSKLKMSQIIDLHKYLVAELNIATGLRNRLIGITGSLYRPLQVQTQLQEVCLEMLATANRTVDPFSKSLLVLAGIAYIQPFEDGNKRTSRLSANAVLLAAGCAPLSYRSISEISYREAMLTFYEKNTLMPLKELFLEQYLFACENYLRF